MVRLVMADKMPQTKFEIKHTRRGGAWFRALNFDYSSRPHLLTECELNFAHQDMSVGVILHEIAHAITFDADESHGPIFCHVFLDLVREYMGEFYADSLRDCFDAVGVMYDPQYEVSTKAAREGWIKTRQKNGRQVYAIPMQGYLAEAAQEALPILQERYGWDFDFSKTRLYLPVTMEPADCSKFFNDFKWNSLVDHWTLRKWRDRIFEELGFSS